jgi:hypothetical protein
MVVLTRNDFRFIDVLESDNLEFRTGFTVSAKFIGKFLAGGLQSPAHILHLRPLIIGTVTDAQDGTFFPESPGAYLKSAKCEALGGDEVSGYKIFQCENIDNAVQVLKYCYPKVDEVGNSVSIGYFDGKKAVDTEKSLEKSFETTLGSQMIYSVRGKDGKRYPVEYFDRVYDQFLWPVVKVYDKEIRGHYFTYFREIEAKNGYLHKGLEGTRARHLSHKIYLELYTCKMINFFKSILGVS